jgi:hypothetical protein
MGVSLKAAGIGGVVVLCVALGAVSGSAQTSGGGAAAGPPPTALAASSPGAAADAKADPNCPLPDVDCAWKQCYPLADKWKSYTACLSTACHVKQQTCIQDLIQDLYDPDREKSRAGG